MIGWWAAPALFQADFSIQKFRSPRQGFVSKYRQATWKYRALMSGVQRTKGYLGVLGPTSRIVTSANRHVP
jgi:hypothetical protein